MKKFFFLFFIVSAPFQLLAQDSYLDIIAKETCEYLQSEEAKNMNPDKQTEKLGLFIISLYNKYDDELLKEGIEIDFNDGSNSGREFGEKVGMNMVKFCPETIIALASDLEEDDEAVENIYEVEGKLIEVSGDEFSTLVLKDQEDKTQKFLWLQNFRGSDRLIKELNIKSVGLFIKVKYRNLECYSPKLNDYIIRKEIVEIIFIE